MVISKITNEEIPEDECWVWKPYKGGKNRFDATRFHLSSRHDPHCSQCHEFCHELYEMRSPTCCGVRWLCYDCIMKVHKFLTGKKTDECPVCGFGILSIGSSVYECVFGHKWKEKQNTIKEVIK